MEGKTIDKKMMIMMNIAIKRTNEAGGPFLWTGILIGTCCTVTLEWYLE
jgi:hypothetical protein